MAINTKPIYSGVGAVGGTELTAANTNSKGTGTIATDIFKAFTADATNGSFVEKVRLNPTSSVANTATTATTIRIYVSSVTSGATTGGTNTFLVAEVSAGSQAADHSTNATAYIDVPLNIALPPGWTILVTTHVAPAANTNWQATVYGGNYTAQ